MPEKIFLNDKLVPADRAKISVFDAGLQHGLGLFETIRIYNKKPFRLNDHIDRLKNSAKTLGLIIDEDTHFFQKAIEKLLSANNLSNARIRITITAGSIKTGIHKEMQSKPTIIITAGPPTDTTENVYQTGVGILLSDYRLTHFDPIAKHKTICFLPKLIALYQAKITNLAESLWLTTEGLLASCSTSNIFFIKDNTIYTPSTELPIVPGITRKVIFELAKENNIKIEEGKFTLNQLLQAEEIFITNSIIEILPVVAIERHKVANQKPGKLTKELIKLYKDKVRAELGE